MNSSSNDNQLYFYLGMLPTFTDKQMLQSSLSHLGKIDRTRVARDKSDLACKGYGYAVVEPLYSATEFIQGCLSLPNPIIAFQIPGPKLLGSENTKMLRRYARVESLAGKTNLLDAVFFVQMFGPVAVLAAEIDQYRPDIVYRLHVLYKADASLKNLKALKRPCISGKPVEVHEYQGHQEYPFTPHANSKTVVVISDLTPASVQSNATKGHTAATAADDCSDDGRNVSDEFKSMSVHSQEMPANTSYETPDANSGEQTVEINGRKFKSGEIKEKCAKNKDFEENGPNAGSAEKEALGAAAKSRLKKFRLIFEKRHTSDNLKFNISLRGL